jgi:hypothetical protein
VTKEDRTDGMKEQNASNAFIGVKKRKDTHRVAHVRRGKIEESERANAWVRRDTHALSILAWLKTYIHTCIQH